MGDTGWWDEVATAAGTVVLRVHGTGEGVRLALEGAGADAEVVLPRDVAAALAAALGVASGTMEDPGGDAGPGAGTGTERSDGGSGSPAGGLLAPSGKDPTRPWGAPRPGLPESLAVRRRALDHLRSVCDDLPETAEVETFGSPTFRVATRTFAVVESEDGLPVVRVKVTPGAQGRLLDDDRYRADVETGVHGWTSLRLDLAGDDDLRDLLVAGYRTVAPPELAASVDVPARGPLAEHPD